MESNEQADRVTSLSSALTRRRENSKIQTTEQQLRDIVGDAVQEHVSNKISRLECSINRMIAQFEGIHNGDASDAALRVTTDRDAVDLASVSMEIPTDDYYKYTCSDLEENLSISRHIILNKIKDLKLRGNLNFHKPIKTGKTSYAQKWLEEALICLEIAFKSDQQKVVPELD
jgi:hypothetical protein